VDSGDAEEAAFSDPDPLDSELLAEDSDPEAGADSEPDVDEVEDPEEGTSPDPLDELESEPEFAVVVGDAGESPDAAGVDSATDALEELEAGAAAEGIAIRVAPPAAVDAGVTTLPV